MANLETLQETLKGDPTAALELFKDNYIEDKELYRDEFDGVRNMRQGQIERRTKKGEAEDAMIPLDFQGLVVGAAMAFLVGEEPKIDIDDERTLRAVHKVWKKNRMGAKLQKFVTALKAETEAVMVFSVKPKTASKEAQIKTQVFTSKDGDFAPIYDDYGDLIAFTWKFLKKDDAGNDKTHQWVWTDEVTYKFIEGEGGMQPYAEGGEEKNLLGKIPVVFMRQERPEWWKVRKLIDRYELSFSKFCDTNDYFGSPMVVIKGEVKDLPDKDKAGKVLVLSAGTDGHGETKDASVEYLTWPHGAESTKLEWEQAKELVLSQTSTPDLSFTSLKGLTPPSGYAMKLQFLGAMFKAKRNSGDLIEAIERMISLFAATLRTFFSAEGAAEEFETTVTLQDPLPEAVESLIETLVLASGGKVMSQKTASALNPLVVDPAEEYTIMQQEQADALGGSFESDATFAPDTEV